MTPLTKTTLDQLSKHGCDGHACKHSSGGAPLGIFYLDQRCHLNAPKFIVKNGDVVVLRCVESSCDNALVSALRSKSIDLLEGSVIDNKSPFMFEQACCTNTGAVSASYETGTGKVSVVCYHCDKLVAVVNVAD